MLHLTKKDKKDAPKRAYYIVNVIEKIDEKYMKKRILFYVIFSLVFAFSACPGFGMQDLEESFAEGNDSYEKGEYDKAVSEYKKILDKGYENGGVYYNIANAYFKTGSLGRAILNYERAFLFMPRSSDLAVNYKFASMEIKGNIIPERGFWQAYFLKTYTTSFTINEFVWITSGIYLLIIILSVFGMMFPNIKKYQKPGVVLFFVFMLFNIVVIDYKIKDIERRAIVITSDAEVLFGPFEGATKFFTLQEGMGVNIIQSKDKWYKVVRPDGKIGWIKDENVEKL